LSDGLPSRKSAKEALRAAGFSNRQIKALLASGWRGVVTESEAEAAELQDTLEALRGSLSSGDVYDGPVPHARNARREPRRIETTPARAVRARTWRCRARLSRG
jgi:hypothetical protein